MKINNLLLIWVIVAVFTISFVSAESYPQGSDITIRVSCVDIDCSQTFTVTVQDPDSILILDDAATSIQSGYLNFTLNSSQTSKNGDYAGFLIGNGGTPDYEKISFKITPNGEVASSASALFYIGLLGLLVIFFGLLVYFGVTTDHIWVKATSWGFGYLFLIGISFIAWRMSADFLTSSPFLITFFYWAFIVLMIGFFPFILALFVYGVYMMLTIKEITDMIDRGIPEGEARDRAGWKK